MKLFLKAVFNFSLFQIFLIIALGGAKYLLIERGLSGQLQGPFIVTFLISLFLLIVALGIVGHIENKGASFEAWQKEHAASKKHMLLANFVIWAMAIQIILWYLFFVYMIAPTSFSFFLFLLLGIVLRNIIDFFFKKKPQLSKEHI